MHQITGGQGYISADDGLAEKAASFVRSFDFCSFSNNIDE